VNISLNIIQSTAAALKRNAAALKRNAAFVNHHPNHRLALALIKNCISQAASLSNQIHNFLSK